VHCCRRDRYPFPRPRLRQEPQALAAVMSKGSPRAGGVRRRRQDGLGGAHRWCRSLRCQVGGRLRRTWPNFLANASKSRGPTATDSADRPDSPSSGLQAAVIGVKRNHKDGRQRVPQPGSPGGRHAPRAAGVLSGLAASWVKAFSEPRLQAVAESILPPSPAQKLDVGADPSGHPQNMPPAVIVGRIASAFGHSRLTDGQRVSAQRVIHYAVGTGLGVAYNGVATRWPAVTRSTGSLAGLAIYAGTHGSALPALGIQRPPWRLAPAAVAWEATSYLLFGATLENARRLLGAPR
jgi:putative membrane protein